MPIQREMDPCDLPFAPHLPDARQPRQRLGRNETFTVEPGFELTMPADKDAVLGRHDQIPPGQPGAKRVGSDQNRFIRSRGPVQRVMAGSDPPDGTRTRILRDDQIANGQIGSPA